MANQRRGGIIQVAVDGTQYEAKGEFSYNIGRPKRTAVKGQDKVHGFSEEPQVAFIEGKLTDRGDLDLDAVVTLTNATVTLQLANGKTIVLREAWYAGEGTGHTNEGEIDLRFEAVTGEES